MQLRSARQRRRRRTKERTLLLIQDRKANRARGVDIGVEQRWDEFACTAERKRSDGSRMAPTVRRTLGRLGGVVCATWDQYSRCQRRKWSHTPSGNVITSLYTPSAHNVWWARPSQQSSRRAPPSPRPATETHAVLAGNSDVPLQEVERLAQLLRPRPEPLQARPLRIS